MAKIRIFLVDDHIMMRESLKRALESEDDIEIVGEAQTARGALDTLEKLELDIVVMDIYMPGGMHGLEALKIIKQRFDVKVIMLTGSQTEDQ